ncbi:MAG: aminoglycoside adenylyltransferase domain-containing protein [Nocardioidaceae bacterium]
MTQQLDPRVREIAEDFCRRVHAVRPGLVEAVHVTGSALTDDWQPAHSDVDTVFVVARPVDAADAEQLGALHAATARDEAERGNPVDGVYLTAAELAAGPDEVAAAPQVVNGVLTLEKPGGQLSWVTWLELGASPVGRVDATTGAMTWSEPVGVTPEVRAKAAGFSRDNLATYWAGIAEEIDAWLAGPESPDDPDAEVHDSVLTWGVLGAPRLLATIEHGRVLSKSASGDFALQRWPSYTDLICRCQRSRAGQEERFTVRDAHEGLGLLRAVLAAGKAAPTHVR